MELTPREVSVLYLAAWGCSNKEISTRLDITVKTVEAHKTSAMRKLGLKDRTELMRYAVREGWLNCGDSDFGAPESFPRAAQRHQTKRS
jgi:DNA-binding NarL/FixJ family response regulator